jgi:hypothetical protein
MARHALMAALRSTWLRGNRCAADGVYSRRVRNRRQDKENDSLPISGRLLSMETR